MKKISIKRIVAFALVAILAMTSFPSLATNVSAASYSWPEFSPSSYAEYIAPANVSSLYQNPEMTVRGTASPLLAYNSSISRGDLLLLLGFNADMSGVVVSYPVGQNRRIAYVPTKTLLGVNAPLESFNAKASVPVYKIAGNVTKWGSIAVNDRLFRCGSATVDGCKYILFVYEAVSNNRGWKIGFLKVSDYELVKGTNSSQDSSGNTTAEAVKKRLDAIGNGSLKYDSKTTMKIGAKFTGTKSNEQCKGFGKNVFKLLFNIVPGSTLPKNKGLNYLIQETTGMVKVGSITQMEPEAISALFRRALPGSFIQIRRNHTGSHSAILYEVNSSGVIFFEANLDGKNTVSLNTYTWSELCKKNAAISVYMPTNYKLK